MIRDSRAGCPTTCGRWKDLDLAADREGLEFALERAVGLLCDISDSGHCLSPWMVARTVPGDGKTAGPARAGCRTVRPERQAEDRSSSAHLQRSGREEPVGHGRGNEQATMVSGTGGRSRSMPKRAGRGCAGEMGAAHGHCRKPDEHGGSWGPRLRSEVPSRAFGGIEGAPECRYRREEESCCARAELRKTTR